MTTKPNPATAIAMARAQRITEIRARAAAATPGPWSWRGNMDYEEPWLASNSAFSDVLTHRSVVVTAEDARRRGVGDVDQLSAIVMPTGMDSDDPEYDRTYTEQVRIAQENAVAEWLDEGGEYGEPRREQRMMFSVDQLLRPARSMVIYEVARTATDRADPRVYRADIAGIRHPDATFIAAARADVDFLLTEIDRLNAPTTS